MMPFVQGGDLDLKATPADFTVGDFTDPEIPRGPWCVWHGYYGNCPECAGKDTRWTFTVVQADEHALVVDESWSGSGPSDTAPPEERVLPPEARPQDTAAAGLGARVPAALDHVPIRVNPGLLAKVRLLLGE